MSINESLLLNNYEGLARTRYLGAFYTPSFTAEILARWGVRTGNESILEPSAGSGALVKAAIDQAKLVATAPKYSVLAFDIDPIAIQELARQDFESIRIVEGDFLKQDPSLYRKVDLVIANPPFIRNHSLDKLRREELRTRFGVPASAGIWASFLAHALTFLKSGGRMAAIVPRSVLFTQHGDKVMRSLCKEFSSVGVYALSHRPSWSVRADEIGAIVLAEGFACGTSEYYPIGVISEDGRPSEVETVESEEYSRLLDKSVELGSVAKISIGVVTGRNKVFLLSEEMREKAGISLEDVKPVVSRARHVLGVKVSCGDLLGLANNGERTWLLQPSKFSSEVEAYLSVISSEELQSVVWFKKRTPWWLVQVDAGFDAVLTYMNDSGPRVATLERGIVCTNTLHRLAFNNKTSEGLKYSAVLSLLSTFGQLAAEKIGRSYGGGVLKFELSEARRLPVINVASVFSKELHDKVDSLLRQGKKEEVRELVDECFMPLVFGRAWRKVQKALLLELNVLRTARRGFAERETK